MKNEFQDVITQYMWVEPIEINSALVSAQNRKRLYWTNIPWVQQPQDKWILLKDILEDEVNEKYNISEMEFTPHTVLSINIKKSFGNISINEFRAENLKSIILKYLSVIFWLQFH